MPYNPPVALTQTSNGENLYILGSSSNGLRLGQIIEVGPVTKQTVTNANFVQTLDVNFATYTIPDPKNPLGPAVPIPSGVYCITSAVKVASSAGGPSPLYSQQTVVTWNLEQYLASSTLAKVDTALTGYGTPAIDLQLGGGAYVVGASSLLNGYYLNNSPQTTLPADVTQNIASAIVNVISSSGAILSCIGQSCLTYLGPNNVSPLCVGQGFV